MSYQNGERNETSPLLQRDGPVENYGSSSHDESHQHDSPSPYLIPVTRLKFWFIFGPILLQYFIAMFDSYFMASSHPVITSYFNASNSASWLSTAFMLTSTSLQPIFGRLSDTIGRRPVYLVSLSAFAVTTIWCATAQSIYSFIAARAVCGIAAGGMMAMVSFFLP
jgi:MFS family permease